MDFSIRRIESSPVRGSGPSKRRRREEEQAVFDLDLEHARPAQQPAPEPSTQHHEDTPVSAPDEDEAGGRLDVTA